MRCTFPIASVALFFMKGFSHVSPEKLLLVLLLLLAAAGGLVFLYWLEQLRPAFSGGHDPSRAVQKKDWDLFCKRVDVAKVYSYALDDMLAELKADGLPEHAIAASLVKSIKKEVVKELIRQTEDPIQGWRPCLQVPLGQACQDPHCLRRLFRPLSHRHLQDRRSGRQNHRLCETPRQRPRPRLHMAGTAGKRRERPLDRDTHPEFYRLSERKDGRVTSDWRLVTGD